MSEEWRSTMYALATVFVYALGQHIEWLRHRHHCSCGECSRWRNRESGGGQ